MHEVGKDSVGKFVPCRLVLGFDLVIPEWVGDIARSLLVLSATINIWGGAQSIKSICDKVYVAMLWRFSDIGHVAGERGG